MLSVFDTFDIFHIFRIGTSGASYRPVFWLNNMGLANTPSPGATKTNTRTSESMVLDHEGLYIPTAPGEISLKGAR